MLFSRERATILAAATTAFGVSSVLRKLAVDRVAPLRYQAFACAVSALTVPLFASLSSRYEPRAPLDLGGLGWLVAATLISQAGNLLFSYALKGNEDVGVTVALSSTSPVIAMMVAFLFLHERPTIQAALGCALVVLGVIIISLR